MDILQKPEFKKEPLDTQKDEKNKTKQQTNRQVHCRKNMTWSDDVFVNGILNNTC